MSLIDRSAAKRKYGLTEYRSLKRKVSATLKKDKRNRAETVADEAYLLRRFGRRLMLYVDGIGT